MRGGFVGVHVGPSSSAEIPDTEDVRLVVLHPSQPHLRGSADSPAMRFTLDAFDRRGSAQRTNRNMVVFVAPDAKRMDELLDATRSYLAWVWIAGRQEELNLSPQQVKQVASNAAQRDETVTSRIAQAYHWVLVPEQADPARPATIAVEKADGGKDRLAERVTDKLTRMGLLAQSVSARTIRLDLDQKLRTVWDRGHVQSGELWSYYCRYPYLTRLRDRATFDAGLRSALSSLIWKAEGFALAESYDQATGRYAGLTCPSGDARFAQITDATLLVSPSAAAAQAARDDAAAGSAEDGAAANVSGPSGARGLPEAVAASAPALPVVRSTRFFGVFRVDPDRYARDLTRVSQEVLQQLAAVDGARLEVTIEIHAHCADGFPDDKVRVVLENARTLKFEPSAFEDD